MIVPPIPSNEPKRLQALKNYGILYTDKDQTYDQITDLASYLTNTPISLISLVSKEEVWFKSAKGMDICASSRDLSFCSYAVGNSGNSLVINDTRLDPRFEEHPYVTNESDPIIFYAGVCLVDRDGYKLGTLCVIDNKPNTISEKNLTVLKTLAKQVVKLIELHHSNNSLKKSKTDLETKNSELRSFAGIVSHDMKMPLANIIVTTDILKAKYASQLDTRAIEYLAYLKQSSFTLSDYITGLLAHYESDNIQTEVNSYFHIHDLLEEIIDVFGIQSDCEINFPETNFEIYSNRTALEQILVNIIGNGLKYNDKERIIIDIDCSYDENLYLFKISDNGLGIPEDKLKTIFDLFATIGTLDRDGKRGHGIGLSTAKKLITALNGEISASSVVGKGTTFQFSIHQENETK